jgi:hypothetical protein
VAKDCPVVLSFLIVFLFNRWSIAITVTDSLNLAHINNPPLDGLLLQHEATRARSEFRNEFSDTLSNSGYDDIGNATAKHCEEKTSALPYRCHALSCLVADVYR